jgi:hypothetical protein
MIVFDSVYGRERALEVTVLCDPRVLAAAGAAGIRLCSFRELPGHGDGRGSAFSGVGRSKQ